MKKTTIVTGRIVFNGGGLRIATLDGDFVDLEDILPRFDRKKMHYDPETGWFQSPILSFKIDTTTKENQP